MMATIDYMRIDAALSGSVSYHVDIMSEDKKL